VKEAKKNKKSSHASFMEYENGREKKPRPLTRLFATAYLKA
jgi:hypothetical protein